MASRSNNQRAPSARWAQCAKADLVMVLRGRVAAPVSSVTRLGNGEPTEHREIDAVFWSSQSAGTARELRGGRIRRKTADAGDEGLVRRTSAADKR